MNLPESECKKHFIYKPCFQREQPDFNQIFESIGELFKEQIFGFCFFKLKFNLLGVKYTDMKCTA